MSARPAASTALKLAGFLKAKVLVPRSLVLRRVSLRRGSGDDLTYIGEGESLAWLERLYDAEAGPPTLLSVLRLPAAVRSMRGQGAVVVELNRWLVPLAPRGGLRALTWVRQVIPLGEGRRLPDGVEAVYGRKVRREGLTMRRTQDLQAVREFYELLYRPYVETRFGLAAHPRGLGELRRAVRRGFLLQVMDKERWVSGAVCRVSRRDVLAVAYGLRGDLEQELRRGALSAANYFLIQWALDAGLQEVDLLRARAHVEDGVFEHKRRLGAVARTDPWPHTRLVLYPPFVGEWPVRCNGHLGVRRGRVQPIGSQGGG